MKNTKQYIGLLNTTLRGIRIVSDSDCSTESAYYVMKAILHSIDSIRIAEEFIRYCNSQYGIHVEY